MGEMVGDPAPRRFVSSIEGGTVEDGGADGSCREEFGGFEDGRDGGGLMVRRSEEREEGESVLALGSIA
jgi:hypothetical protein